MEPSNQRPKKTFLYQLSKDEIATQRQMASQRAKEGISHSYDSTEILRDKIKKGLKINDLVSHYTKLETKGVNYCGICPFCGGNRVFYVIPKKNIFKCFACGQGGDPISFVVHYENITFLEAIYYIHEKFYKTLSSSTEEWNLDNSKLRGFVYVLELEDACYYIGFSVNLDKRIADHENGRGAIWTKIHRPIQAIEIHKNKTLNYENYLTELFIKKYGYGKVRGGDHLHFHKKYSNGTTKKIS